MPERSRRPESDFCPGAASTMLHDSPAPCSSFFPSCDSSNVDAFSRTVSSFSLSIRNVRMRLPRSLASTKKTASADARRLKYRPEGAGSAVTRAGKPSTSMATVTSAAPASFASPPDPSPSRPVFFVSSASPSSPDDSSSLFGSKRGGPSAASVAAYTRVGRV